MASYIEDALIKDERVLYFGNISLWSLWAYILGGFVLLPAFGIGLFVWLAAWMRYKSFELAVTNKRIISKHGLVSRQTIEIPLSRIESIQVHQSAWGRIFNFGSLSITGAGSAQAPILAISNPMGFRRAVTEAQDEAIQR